MFTPIQKAKKSITSLKWTQFKCGQFYSTPSRWAILRVAWNNGTVWQLEDETKNGQIVGHFNNLKEAQEIALRFSMARNR